MFKNYALYWANGEMYIASNYITKASKLMDQIGEFNVLENLAVCQKLYFLIFRIPLTKYILRII